jgi:hypothetical protein
MKNQDALTKSLAVVGTVLVWIPILAPILFSFAFVITENVWRFDYLMPAELFLLALIGGSLLIWATIRAHSHQRLVGWALATAVFLLAGGQALAELTGLASGAAEAAGWRLGLVLASLVGYSLALVALGIGGLLLLLKLFKKAVLSMEVL